MILLMSEFLSNPIKIPTAKSQRSPIHLNPKHIIQINGKQL